MAAEYRREDVATPGVAPLRASGTPVDRDVLAVLGYVSRGRRYVDVVPYPDAAARRALGRLHDAQPVRLPSPSEAEQRRPMAPTSLQALRDLASGLTSLQIAARQDLTESAVTMRLARAREYLGAATNAQAVYEATMRGLLKGVPRP